MVRKRNPKPVQPVQPVQPVMTHPPTFEEAIAVLSRTLNYVALSGIKIEWANYQGSLALTFKGVMLDTNRETGQARFVRSADYVAAIAYEAIKSKKH